MLIEGVNIKQIKIKNVSPNPKQIYLVLRVDQKKYVGEIIHLKYLQHMYVYIGEKLNLYLNHDSEVFIELWNYDMVRMMKEVKVSTDKLLINKYCKILVSDFQFLIWSETKQILIQSNKQLKIQKGNHQNSENYKNQAKKLISSYRQKHQKQQKRKINNQSKRSIKSYKQELSYGLSFDEEQDNETSLEKRIHFPNKQSNQKNYLNTNKQIQLLDLIQNRKSSKIPKINLNFDDYEASYRNQQNSRNHQQSRNHQNIESSKQNIKLSNNFSQKARQTGSSTLIKKNLKNTIKYLTQNHLKNDYAQDALNQKDKTRLSHKSKQYLQYGLAPNRNKKNKNTQTNLSTNFANLKNQKNLQKIYEKSLTKKQIQRVNKMSSFQLSKSIFQQYGLDLSLNQLKNGDNKFSKNSQKNKRQQTNKIEHFSSNKFLKQLSKKNQLKRDQKFEDYGEEQSFNRNQISKAKSFKSLKHVSISESFK